MSITEEIPHFRIKKNDKILELSQAPEPDCERDDFLDLKVYVKWRELTFLASQIECERTKDILRPRDLDGYHRFLVFCAARNGISEDKLFDLSRIVLGLNGYDLTYWALQFKKAFWSDSDPSSTLRKIAASFQLLFGLV